MPVSQATSKGLSLSPEQNSKTIGFTKTLEKTLKCERKVWSLTPACWILYKHGAGRKFQCQIVWDLNKFSKQEVFLWLPGWFEQAGAMLWVPPFPRYIPIGHHHIHTCSHTYGCFPSNLVRAVFLCSHKKGEQLPGHTSTHNFSCL